MEPETGFHESRMLAAVRRWRKEAYDSDQRMTRQERIKEQEDLLRQFGLKPVNRTRKPD